MTIAILSDGLSKKINMSTYIDKTIKLRSFTGYARWMRDEYVMWNNTNVYYSVGFNSSTITTNRYVWASLQFFDPYGYHDFIVLKKCQIEFILIGGGGNGGYSNGSGGVGGGGGGSGGGIAQGLITANPGDAFCMILGLSGSSTVLQQVVSVNQGTYRAYNVAQAAGGANGGDTDKTEGRSGANGSGGRGESTVANGGSPGGSYGSRHPRPGLVPSSRTGHRGGVGANATPFTGGGGGGLGGVGGDGASNGVGGGGISIPLASQAGVFCRTVFGGGGGGAAGLDSAAGWTTIGRGGGGGSSASFNGCPADANSGSGSGGTTASGNSQYGATGYAYVRWFLE